ncbi:DNA repair protein RAD51 homolog 4 [Stomoxys calcitrans]|uniref:RecA family profile 1 domain-containing protein n=1 Tax=Stomoxys calcitrans TaxID=35570 RepID=A0A1I8Q630_STOCA|nr:DNA repair protein RAD51 homolog 4 [Stomoxys calcitrans]
MSKLRPIKNTELSEYCINILAKHDIHIVGELLKEKPEKIMKILNLNSGQVQKIRYELRRIYGPTRTTLEKQSSKNENVTKDFQISFTFCDGIKPVEIKTSGQCFSTLIGPLDDMLAPNLKVHGTNSNGDSIYSLGPSHLTSKVMWEICGPSGVGKTQLALTLICNFVQLYASEVLYIDTKLDFSASRVKRLLTSRQLTPDTIAGTLQAIKVERVLSAQGVIEMLELLYAELRQGSNHVNSIKMIVIDSLPAVWFLLKADANRLAGKYLLSRLSQMLYRLCDEYNIAVICINLSIIPSPKTNEDPNKNEALSVFCKDDQDISDILEDDDLDEETKNLTYRQVMGYFWLSKPRLRLSMEYMSAEEQEIRTSSRRLLQVTQSTCMREKKSCTVRICDQGVV